MTCKDCLHYGACSKWLKQNCDEGFMCENFTDRSEWVHLPCKVGNTVYGFCKEFNAVLPYFVENINFVYLGYENELYVCTVEANCTNKDELLDSIDFEPTDIGKTVFFTPKEAEKALEEQK